MVTLKKIFLPVYSKPWPVLFGKISAFVFFKNVYKLQKYVIFDIYTINYYFTTLKKIFFKKFFHIQKLKTRLHATRKNPYLIWLIFVNFRVKTKFCKFSCNVQKKNFFLNFTLKVAKIIQFEYGFFSLVCNQHSSF